MASLFDKARLAFLANAHGLLNRVIDLNSIGAVEQNVRDLTQAVETLKADTAVAQARITDLGRQQQCRTTRVATIDKSVAVLLGDDNKTNDLKARSLLGQKRDLLLEIKQFDEDKVTMSADFDKLTDTCGKMEAKLGEMRRNLTRLRSMKDTTDAKAKAAKAISRAADVFGSVDGTNVDNLTDRMREQSVRADSKLDSAMGRIGDDPGMVERDGEIEAMLAEAKAKATGTQPTT